MADKLVQIGEYIKPFRPLLAGFIPLVTDHITPFEHHTFSGTHYYHVPNTVCKMISC